MSESQYSEMYEARAAFLRQGQLDEGIYMYTNKYVYMCVLCMCVRVSEYMSARVYIGLGLGGMRGGQMLHRGRVLHGRGGGGELSRGHMIGGMMGYGDQGEEMFAGIHFQKHSVWCLYIKKILFIVNLYRNRTGQGERMFAGTRDFLRYRYLRDFRIFPPRFPDFSFRIFSEISGFPEREREGGRECVRVPSVKSEGDIVLGLF
jgi:hypothetical protein